MKRVLLVASLVVASAFAPVSAGPPTPGNPSGYCDGDIDVVCRPHRCEFDLPCNIEFCAVWYYGACK